MYVGRCQSAFRHPACYIHSSPKHGATVKPINRYRITTALFLGILGYVPLWGQNLDFAPDRPDGPAKIQSALWELATPGAAKPTRDLQDTVVVILVPYPGQASASIDTSSLATLGGKVLAQSKSLMRVSIPESSLLAVSELPGVRFVRKPYRPHAQQETWETWSEGRRLIKAYDNYFEGVRGQGVKVAIIDGGFKGANELSGDMPARWRYRDYTGEGIYAGEIVHGTACAEIVHDVAPEAEIYLYKVEDLVDLENATDSCIRNGIDIINHSMGWFGTGIGDGRGDACDIVNDAADKGILWVNSAGNDAQSHYYGFWFNSDDDSWHNFEGEKEGLNFEAEEGEEIRVFLTWNDWPNSRENYDLYLFFVNSSDDLERVDRSTDRQNGYGDVPVERIEYKVERSGKYLIAVRSEDARPRRLKIWSLNHDFEEYSVAENSIGSPSDARGAMSVGAVHYDYYDLGRIADYSSRGPTTDGRFKPELVAPSGVSTVSYGESEEFYGYTGTSAAAPHVAGAAALIKSANPSYSRTQLWDALIEATVDIGTPGRDNDSGYGKLVLPILLHQLPSSGIFGYNLPEITQNPKSVKFGFEGIEEDVAMTWAMKNDAEVDILVNGQELRGVPIPIRDDWQSWWTILSQTDLNSGQNVIEFRNKVNQNRTSSFTHWQLKDVKLWKPFNAKPVAGAIFLGSSLAVVESGLGDPFPTPFNAEVTIPFVLAEAGPVRLAIYNLMGQQVLVLADEWVDAGAHRVRWDGRTAAGVESASGVYWAVLQAGGAVQTAKLALIR